MTRISIRSTSETRKQLEATLRQAFKAGDVTLVKRVKRVTALLGVARGEAVETVAAGVGVGRATVSAWLRTLLLEGVGSLRVQWKGAARRS